MRSFALVACRGWMVMPMRWKEMNPEFGTRQIFRCVVLPLYTSTTAMGQEAFAPKTVSRAR